MSRDSELAARTRQNEDDIEVMTALRLALSRLDQMAAAAGPVQFAGYEAVGLALENRTSDPGSPSTGQIWLRTDLP